MFKMSRILPDRSFWCIYRQPITWLTMGLTGFAYYQSAILSVSLGLPNSPSITPIWIPAPIAWATLYLGGNHLIPGIAIANFITNFDVLTKTLTVEKALVPSLIQTIITLLTTVVGANLLRIFFVGRILDRVRNVVVFIATGLLIPVITPTLSLVYMMLLGIVPWSLSGQVWKTWWIGDALSVIIGMPMLVSWQRFRWRQMVWNRSWDVGLLLLGFGLLSGFTFLSDYPLQYLVLPGLLWAAIRLGDCGATFGVVAVTLMIILATAMGRGPFLRSSLNESLVLLQTFMGTITLTTLLMLATIAEKAKTQRDLAIVNENLELRVRDRTEELERILSELKQAQTQLVQTEKMSSLGQLVAGLAHEINNPISFIYGNITYAQNYSRDLLSIISAYQAEYPQPDRKLEAVVNDLELDYILDDFPKVLNSMKAGADRIRQLILTLRNFSRLDEGGLKKVDLHQGLDSTLFVLNYRLTQSHGGRQIEVIKKYDEFPKIECYADELNQAFLHLLNNAIDSLEANNSNPPILLINTKYYPDDKAVEVSIWTDGPPISLATRSKMFNPFFTTKPIGQGPGLGLPISQRIIEERHGGTLGYRSELGNGTEFYLRIPIKQSQVKSPNDLKVEYSELRNLRAASDEVLAPLLPELPDV